MKMQVSVKVFTNNDNICSHGIVLLNTIKVRAFEEVLSYTDQICVNAKGAQYQLMEVRDPEVGS